MTVAAFCGHGRAAVLAVCLTGAVLHAQTADLPPATRAVLLLRVLAYDYSLKNHPTGVTIMLLRHKDDPASARECDSLFQALQAAAAKVTVKNQNVRATLVDLEVAGLGQRVTADSVSALYVCDGLGGQLPQIAKVAADQQILTFAGSEAYVRAGLGLGLVARGGKAAVLVNLPVVRAQGAELDAGLLKVSEVIR